MSAPKDTILVGDSLEVLKSLPDACVDCCITSPPYYGLRDYGVAGQLGLEKSPLDYIQKIVAVFREVRRVLKDDGTLWLNIADSYAGSGKGRLKDGSHSADKSKSGSYLSSVGGSLSPTKADGIKRKDLIGIPWLVAFALRQDGWYLRQDIIWSKTNAMPESVKDRCTKSHEYIFLLSKSERYYFNSEAIKEPAVGFDNSLPAGSRGTLRPNSRLRKGNARSFRGGGAYTAGRAFHNGTETCRETHGNTENKTGLRNKRDVWSISTQGYKGAHFATFPEKLIEPCVLAGCKENGLVLDPFIGSGTTAVVAKKHGRNYIGIELNEEYAKMANGRIKKGSKE